MILYDLLGGMDILAFCSRYADHELLVVSYPEAL